MTPEDKSRRLKGWALEVGFDRAGVARLGRSRHGEAFLAWLERGDQAGMSYLERRTELRRDPRLLLHEGARSVVCVALQYHPPAGGAPVEGDFWPGVARYARGEDYHDLMGERLKRLARRVEKAFPGTGTRRHVDTGPVLERELAARAGLGAIGKNTNLLHPEAGSWFLLGELFLTLELAPDPPLADLCGACTRCLEACPTGALPEPYRLDSRRCISYWTIEHRGPVPEEMRQQLGEWVFGCDVCQEVCPWNDSPTAAVEARFGLAGERRELDLETLLALDRERYLELLRGSPLKRARLDGLRRNAALAMGNRGDERYLRPLARALGDADALLRRHAAWALGRLGGEAARRELAAALPEESDPEVAREIRRALSG